MNGGGRSVILFASSHHAIWASRLLAARSIAARLVPTPRHLSSECGHAVELPRADAPRAAGALRERGVPFERVAEI